MRSMQEGFCKWAGQFSACGNPIDGDEQTKKWVMGLWEPKGQMPTT